MSGGACQVNWLFGTIPLLTSPLSPTYYLPIIASERIQRRIERLLEVK